MQFVSDHIHPKHALTRPHKWIAALVLSPIHAAELSYKKKYHLTYVHARKLFFIDTILLLATFLLFGLTIFWFTYDPTIVSEIELRLAVASLDPDNSDGRIRSGEPVQYTVTYQNNSEVVIEEVALQLRLPDGVTVTEGTRNLPIGTLAPGEGGEHMLSGRFLEDVTSNHQVLAILSYRQAERSFTEQRAASILKTVRGSIVTSELTAPDQILSTGSYPVSLRITNDGPYTIEAVTVPLPTTGPYRISQSAPSRGQVSPTQWTIPTLAPDETAQLDATLTVSLGANDSTTVSLQPAIQLADRGVQQTPADHTFDVIRPEARVSSQWEDTAPLPPGETKNLIVTVENTGTVPLQDPVITMEVPTAVDISSLRLINNARIEGNVIVAPLTDNLDAGEREVVTLAIPVYSRISSGVDLTLSLAPQLRATVAALPDTAYRSPVGQSDEIKIGTTAFLAAESRYYTNEGDQLGRGSLPPRVGEETKYWAFVSIQNTTSRLINMAATIKLPPHIVWTGRSSVSHGRDLSFNESNRTVSWNHNIIGPHDTIGLFMELSLTPTPDMIGTTPTLVESIRFTGEDPFTERFIERTFGSIDVSLPNDDIAQGRGVVVQ